MSEKPTGKRPGRKENLVPTNQRTKDEARELGRAGGIASGEVRREKKRMADIYAEVLAKQFQAGVDAEGKPVKISGHEKIATVIANILQREDSAAVSMIKELREGIDGNRVEVEFDDVSTLTPEERKARIAALRGRLGS